MEGVGESMTSFVAYPNPTSGTLYLVLSDAQQFEYEVCDLVGQVVMRGSAEGREVSIDLSDCHQGMYLVAIHYDGSHMMQKVMVK